MLFNCLVDGISLLEYDGAELIINANGHAAATGLDAATFSGITPIIHFDIKPDNCKIHSAIPE